MKTTSLNLKQCVQLLHWSSRGNGEITLEHTLDDLRETVECECKEHCLPLKEWMVAAKVGKDNGRAYIGAHWLAGAYAYLYTDENNLLWLEYGVHETPLYLSDDNGYQWLGHPQMNNELADQFLEAMDLHR